MSDQSDERSASATSVNGSALPVFSPAWSDEMRWFFEVNGYLLIENVLTFEEIERYKAAADRVISEAGRSQVMGMIEADPAFTELMDHPVIFPIAIALLGPHIQVFGSTLISNQRESKFVQDWHQDGPITTKYRDLAYPTPLVQLRFAYFLTDCPDTNHGGLSIIPGSHKARTPMPDGIYEMPGVTVPILGKAGSVFAFQNALWHGGMPNQTDSPRITAHVMYSPIWVRPVKNHRYREEFKRGLTPVRRLLLGDNDDPTDVYRATPYGYNEDGSIRSG
ncbi:MAG: phytanoyl-CoA dioxygenase family protein [Chloroflexi bacterium]|nr:phytanoyl-CoA dioxygenase family protein [Chloroflexota bacterium]